MCNQANNDHYCFASSVFFYYPSPISCITVEHVLDFKLRKLSLVEAFVLNHGGTSILVTVVYEYTYVNAYYWSWY